MTEHASDVAQAFEAAKEAAYAGDIETFNTLIADVPDLVKSEPPPDHPNDDHPSIFQYVVVEGGLGKIPEPSRFVQTMIAAGGAMDAPLVAAASVNSVEIVDQLMQAGVNIESCAPWTALEETLYWCHLDMAEHLQQKHQAAINSLRAAAELNRLDLMQHYFDDQGRVSAGAGNVVYPFGHVSEDRQDVLDQACFLALRNNQYEAAAFLLERGAELNRIVPGHHEQCTPLHQAVYLNRPEMVDWLLERGARADIEDPRYHHNAVQWARHFEREEMASHIESYF